MRNKELTRAFGFMLMLLVPLLFLPFILSYPLDGQNSFSLVNLIPIVAFIVASVIGYFRAVSYFAGHAKSNKLLTEREQALWTMMFVFFNIPAMTFYTIKFIKQ